MNFLTRVGDFLLGSTAKTIVETIKDYFPPSMTEKEKVELSMKIEQVESEKNLRTMELINEGNREFNNRMKEMEGTAADLKTVPIVGHIIILARGAQRPLWGLATMYIDFQVLSGAWSSAGEARLQLILFVINFLVLTFLFGERAIQNILPFVAPLISSIVGKNKQ